MKSQSFRTQNHGASYIVITKCRSLMSAKTNHTDTYGSSCFCTVIVLSRDPPGDPFPVLTAKLWIETKRNEDCARQNC